MVPQLTFFTELETAALASLLRRSRVLDQLAAHRHGIAMAMLDFSAERAAIVRLLTQRGVAVTARLLLPADAGYWFNVENYPQAMPHYQAFREWALAEGLDFAAVGLSMEPSLRQMKGLRAGYLESIYSSLIAARSNALFPAAQRAYQELAANIRSDGYAVHTYQLPFVVDDRRAGTTLIQRALDVVDLAADVEVLMVYSSLVPRALFTNDLCGALVAEYGPYADSLAIGSTGGGIAADPTEHSPGSRLSWAELERDLRIAAEFTDTIHVFTLEGSVEAGYFERLDHVDWSTAPVIPWRYRLVMRSLHTAIGAALWWSRSGLTLLGWLGWVVAGTLVVKRAAGRWRRDP